MSDVTPLTDAATVERSEAPALDGLGRDVARGLRWSFVSTIATKLVTFLTGVLLARLLDSQDFGLYAVAFLALTLTASLNDLGIEAALVRWPGELEDVLWTAATVVIGLSLTIFAIFFVGADVFARMLGAPGAGGLVRFMAVGLLVNAAFTIHSALLTRNFRQDLRTYAEMSGLVVSTAATVGLSVLGLGAWSLAWGRIAGNLVIGVLMMVFSRRGLRLGFDREAAGRLLRAGVPIAAGALVTVAVLNVDYLVVGRTLGPAELGFYLMAWNLSSWPVNIFSLSVSKVSVAGFARLQGDRDGLETSFVKSMTLLLLVTVPLCVMIGLLALPLVRVVYGSKWSPSAGPLAFLAIVAVVRIASTFVRDMLVATGRATMSLVLMLVWLASLAPALVVGTHIDSIRGAGVGHLVIAVGVMVPAHLVALRLAGFRSIRFAWSVSRPVLGGTLAAAGLLATAYLVGNDLVRLMVGGAVAVVLYGVVALPLIREYWSNRRRPEALPA